MNINVDLNAIVDKIAQALGTTAEYVYPLMVRQSIVDGINAIIWVLVGVVILILAAAVYRGGVKALARLRVESPHYIWNWGDDDSDTEWRVVVIILMCLVGGLMVAFNINETISNLVNPEGQAIFKILEMIK